MTPMPTVSAQFARTGLAAAATLVLLGVISAALAQSEKPFGGFKHDSTKPIEITSDALEVREAESIAIFSGTVEAGQGTLRLTADRMTVAFDPDDQDSETGAIKNVKAEGNVFLTNGAETAQGAAAEYDIVTGQMVMRGKVVLTQGANAVAGERLDIDLNTGVAKIRGGASAGGRVKSTFLPASGGTGG